MESNEKIDLAALCDDLFQFAIDRDDVKWLLARLPKESPVRPATVEYELQLLKMITVGWSIAYYLERHPMKTPLAERYWQAVNEFAGNLSDTTGLLIGQEIDYFQILKDRLDAYVGALSRNTETLEPAQIIGPVFAEHCGDRDDLFAFMTGSKMFFTTLTRVREYFETIRLL